jgi:cytoskeletal protein CcmA (bactofilin family)
MKISGSGTLSEGKINDRIRVSGSVKLKGNLECEGFHSSGSLRGEGNLTVHGDIKSSGSFRTTGSIYGDGNFRSSGSTSIEGEVLIKGTLESSGSFRAGKKVRAIQSIKISGSSHINGELSSQDTILLTGSSTIYGNVIGNHVSIGHEPRLSIGVYKHPNKIYGNISSRTIVDITKTLVDGDIKGFNVNIGRGSEITGNVYYVNEIEVNKKVILANDPIKISQEELYQQI